MNKAIPAILIILSLALLFVSCNSDNSVDEAFNCTITFDGNGAAGEMPTQTESIGKEIRLSTNGYERDKYTFIGWNTKADGSGTAYSDGQIISLTGDITLYAQWEIIPIILDSSMDEWTDGNVYILNSDVTIGDRIDVLGSVTLVLSDGFTLTASDGISVNGGNTLTINANGAGTGILETTGNGGDAGIGGYDNYNCGTIIINGGTVNASGDGGGAGIGGGRHGNGGTIVINGGTVSARSETGGATGAGIGGGRSESGGTITINGGIVNAVSRNGAGIGGGNQGSGGIITINGGTVNASADSGLSGIGKGVSGDSDGTLTLGKGVALQVSHNNTDWSDYDETTRQKYMRTK